MKKIAFVFIAAMTVLSFGCKKKGGDMKEAMAKMEGFKNDMCKCKAGDKACAEKVANDMKAYADSMKGKEKDMAKPSPDDEKKMAGVIMEMGKCQTAAMTDPAAATPPATPPAGDPAAAGGTPPAGGDMKPADPAAGGTPPAAGGDMKKEEPKKEEMKK